MGLCDSEGGGLRVSYYFQELPMPRVKPTKATGGFSFGAVAVLRTIVSTEPGGVEEKGTGMAQNIVTRCKSVKSCGGLNPQAGG